MNVQMARRVILTLTLTLTLLAIVSAQRPVAAQTLWTTHSSVEGRLTVLIPCAPSWRTAQETGFVSHISVCTSGDERYLIGWVDYPPNYRATSEAELKANQDNFVKGVEGVLLTSTPITVAGRPGLEFTTNVKGALLMTTRVIMDGMRPYQVTTVTPLGQDRADNIRKFLTSLRISSAPQP